MRPSVYTAVLLPTLLAGQASADTLIGFEEPVNGAFHSGVGNIRGWAVTTHAIDSVSVSIDGEAAMLIPYGGPRPDVAAGFPGYPDSDRSGFSMAFNYGNLQPGTHTAVLTVCDSTNACRQASATFDTAHAGQPFVQQLDLSGAGAKVDRDGIRITGVEVDGQPVDLRLVWSRASQGFVIAEGIGQPVQNPQFIQTFLSLINAARSLPQRCGSTDYPAVGALNWDHALAAAAQAHSDDMADNDFFDHQGSDGSRFNNRALAAGYQGQPLGENIAAGYPNLQTVVQGWLDSSGHCSAIMNTNANEVGAAVTVGGSLGLYWTMVTGAGL